MGPPHQQVSIPRECREDPPEGPAPSAAHGLSFRAGGRLAAQTIERLAGKRTRDVRGARAAHRVWQLASAQRAAGRGPGWHGPCRAGERDAVRSEAYDTDVRPQKQACRGKQAGDRWRDLVPLPLIQPRVKARPARALGVGRGWGSQRSRRQIQRRIRPSRERPNPPSSRPLSYSQFPTYTNQLRRVASSMRVCRSGLTGGSQGVLAFSS